MKKRFIAGFIAFSLLFSVADIINVPIQVNAEGLVVEIFDDLKNGETLFEDSLSTLGNLGYATSAQTNLTDRTRMYKLSDATPELDENTYITYYSEHANMTDFTIITAIRKNKADDNYAISFRFEVSEDGVSFSSFNEFETIIPQTSWGRDAWREIPIHSTAKLPENTQYLRIFMTPTNFLTAPGNSASNTSSQLGSVRISCSDTSSEAALTDLADKVSITLNGAVQGDSTGMYPPEAFVPLQTALDNVQAIIANYPSSTVQERTEAYLALSGALDVFLASVIKADKIVDDCTDFSKVYEKSSDIEVIYSEPENFGGDGARFVRENAMSGEYLVYKADESSALTSFEVNAWYNKIGGNISEDMRIEAAPFDANPFDDASYKIVSVVKTIENGANWLNDEWRMIHFTVEELPIGTEYVRVTFGDSSITGDCRNIQIGSIAWTEDDKGIRLILANFSADVRQMLNELLNNPNSYPPEAFVSLYDVLDETDSLSNDPAATDSDLKAMFNFLYNALRIFEDSEISTNQYFDECGDWSKAYSRSGSDITVTNSSPEKFEGDDTRFSRQSSSPMVGGHVVYAASEGQRISYFEVNAWYNKYNNVIPKDMIIEAAPLGANPMLDDSYTVVPAVKTIKNQSNWPNDAWRLNTFTVSELPPNTGYVRVTFGDTSNTGKSWTIHIGSIAWEEMSADYRFTLLPLIEKASQLLTDIPMGNEVYMCPEIPYNKLLLEKGRANETYLRLDATAQELQESYQELKQAIAEFEEAIIRALNWPEGAVLTTSEITQSHITLTWVDVVEMSSDVTYYIYQNQQQIGQTKDSVFTIDKLSQGKVFSFSVIARKGSDESIVLGPLTVQTMRYGDLPAPDFSKIRPEDFDDEDYIAPLVWGNDKRGIPYYFYNLHTVLNGVRMEEPNRGFVDILVVRNPDVFRLYNSRLQEVYLPISYFYTRNSDWNIYYGSDEVKIRLEAILEYLLTLQNSAGSFSEYGATSNSLPGTSFNVNYLGQMMRLLREAEKANPDFPSIDPDLFERMDQAIRKGIMLILTNSAMWNEGRKYTNQYGLVWSAALAYLEYHPDDTAMLNAFKARWAQSDLLISPAGFYYEESKFDMPYNLGVHMNNIAAEYNYMKDTEFEDDLIEHQTKFFDWLSYNLVLEPDGSWIIANAAASSRIEAAGLRLYRKDIPLAEKIPIARAFVRSEGDIEDEIREAKEAITKNGAWPVLPQMTLTGGNAYNPYALYDRLMYQYYPTDEERQEAIDMLPYNSKEYFNHQRSDGSFTFSFIKRPSYYTIFNAATRSSAFQTFGLGILWHPEGGTFLGNFGESKIPSERNYPVAYNYAWGTKAFQTPLDQKHYRVYENSTLDPSYTLNGKIHMPTGAIADLPDGDLTITYTLGDVGTKTVRYTDEGIEVEISHDGSFQECFPVMIRKEDKVEMFIDRFRIVRGRTVFEIIFDRNVEFKLEDKDYKQSRLALNLLSAKSWNELKYSIKMYTQEPTLREPGSLIQVQMDVSNVINTPTVGQSANTQISWNELNLYGDVTRAQFTAAVVDSLGMVGNPNRYKEFVDIPINAWYRERILTAVQLGLIVGVDDNHFAPEQTINKEHRALILGRAKEFLNEKLLLTGKMMSEVDGAE